MHFGFKTGATQQASKSYAQSIDPFKVNAAILPGGAKLLG